MEYRTGRIGRVIIARVDHGDDLLAELTKLAESERINHAFFMMIGAIRDAQIVTGPKESTIPPDPMWHRVADAHEILGVGNILRKRGEHGGHGEPAIHLHAALGRGEESIVGCLRDRVDTYLTVEVVIFEIAGVGDGGGDDAPAERAYDDALGVARMMF